MPRLVTGSADAARCLLSAHRRNSCRPELRVSNGDGASDVLWVNSSSGQLVEWLTNGTSVIGGGSPGSAAGPWQIQGMNSD